MKEVQIIILTLAVAVSIYLGWREFNKLNEKITNLNTRINNIQLSKNKAESSNIEILNRIPINNLPNRPSTPHPNIICKDNTPVFSNHLDDKNQFIPKKTPSQLNIDNLEKDFDKNELQLLVDKLSPIPTINHEETLSENWEDDEIMAKNQKETKKR